MVLAGCAASPQEIRSAARQSSSMEICLNLGRFGANDHILYEELARRGENCQQYSAAMAAQQARRAANAANAAATARIIQSLQPPPMAPPPMPIDCTSVRSGSVVNTTCR